MIPISYLLYKTSINNIMCTRNTQNCKYRYLKIYNHFSLYYIGRVFEKVHTYTIV